MAIVINVIIIVCVDDEVNDNRIDVKIRIYDTI